MTLTGGCECKKFNILDNQQPSIGVIMKDKGSETIPDGSRDENLEMVATVYFYALLCPFTLQIKYIGRTVDINNRLRNHIYEAKKNNRNKRERWIMYLLRKNQKPLVKILWQGTLCVDDAIKIEKHLIRHYRRKYDLKNSNDHGLGGSFSTQNVFQYDLEGNYITMYINSNQACIETGVKDCNIARCCKNENGYGSKTAGGFFWSYIKYDKFPFKYISNWRNLKGKTVVSKNIIDGSEQTFVSAREAEKALGVNYKHISACCNGKRKTAGGYTWKFKVNC